MRWQGELKTVGYYKLVTADNEPPWLLRHRHPSQREPLGWYLYSGDGRVVGRFMHAKLAPAQHAAEQFASAYTAEQHADEAKREELDDVWERALRNVG